MVHNYPVYLRMFHWLGALAEKMIASKFNTSVTSTYISKDYEFEMDGVHVIRIPLFKPFPHGAVPRRSLSRQVEKIHKYCESQGFIPDCITSHNFYPHLEMVNNLKSQYYTKARTCVVVHKQNLKMLEYVKDYKEEVRKVDTWGYRSLPLKREFEGYINMDLPHFMCYSGIPAHFLNRNQNNNIKQPINRFVYVGSFIKRKHPEKLLYALKRTGMDDFSLCYVGDGIGRKTMENFVKENGWRDKVELKGIIAREEVPDVLAKAQCFIMISEQETFGLVYLEAMSMGCITIASRDEGMEGIIIDGQNGFLCKAGDDEELADVINKIRKMSNEQLAEISENARQTALRLTDSKVATDYIKAIYD